MTSSIHTTGNGQQSYFKTGSGPAVIIIHGIGGHKEDWQSVAQALESTHTVYAVDMLGFGGSSRDATDLGMAAQAASLKALLDQEGLARVSLVGNSVGGWVAATFASTFPESTEKLVVIDPAGFAAMFEGEPPVNLFPDDEDQMAKLLSYVIHSDFAHSPEFAAQAFAQFAASGEKSIVPVLMPSLFKSARLEEILPKITSPTLVIWGKEDRLFPAALCPYLTSLVPGAKSFVIENASHFVQIDQPAILNAALIDFLA